MKKKYELSEFIFLLRLGLWTGGEIIDMGYVSGARNVKKDDVIAGLTGLWLGSGIMLEDSKSRISGETNLTFSIYEPYTGYYNFLSVDVNYEGDLSSLIIKLIKKSGRIGNIKAYESLHSKRRYVAKHTSMRSGSILTTKRNR